MNTSPVFLWRILYSCSTALQLADWLPSACELRDLSSFATPVTLQQSLSCQEMGVNLGRGSLAGSKIAKRLGSLHRSCDMEATATWTWGEIWSCNQSNWLLNSFRQDARQWEGLLWNTSNRPSRGCVWKWIGISHFHPFPMAKISNGKIRPRMAISSQNMMISGNFPRTYGQKYGTNVPLF